MAHPVSEIRGDQQTLARHTSRPQAVTAHPRALHQRHSRPDPGGHQARHQAAGAAHDHQVVAIDSGRRSPRAGHAAHGIQERYARLLVVAAPTYVQRLRLEGAVLASCGTIGTVALLAITAEARRAPASTGAQLLVVAGLLAWFGPRGVRRSIARSNQLPAQDVGSGEPTPVWHIVAIAVILTVLAGELGGWDAGLRVTAGCLLVGTFQALVLGQAVTSQQRARGRTYYRIAGSRILKGTRLGHVAQDSDGAAPRRAKA